MIKLAVLIFLGYIAYKILSEAFFGSEEEKPKHRPAGAVKDELVQDPQCGVYIPKSSALKRGDGRYFCSRECLEAWEKRREREG
ncbi:hypothetical protein EPN96_04160 [bacterium]|nr:MAG: hypothetical protein EPN96_04160 [bacterium]